MSLTEVGPGRGYFFGRPKLYRYGNNRMLAFLRELSDLYGADNDGYPFGIGDLSLKNGGIPGSERGTPYHTTHMDGWCVDLFIVSNQKGRGNSIANTGGEPQPTLKYTDKEANYNFKCTCALMDIILELRGRGYPMHEIIYEDANVRPEARLTQWLADHNLGGKTELETKYGATPELAHRISGLGLMALHATMPIVHRFEAPPRELLRTSNIRLKAPSEHKDHIHVKLN